MVQVRYMVRVVLLSTVVILVFLGISIRLAFLQIKPAEWIITPIQEARKYEWKPVGSRGRIVDRNGEILAMDVTAYHVTLDPKYIHEHGDPELVVKYLSREFRIPEEELREELSDVDRQWVAIQRFVPENRLQRFERKALGSLYTPREPLEGGETNVFLRGVKLEETSIRNYPKRSLMAHVVGFSNMEGTGSAGIERQLNEYLLGKEGQRESLLDGNRREIYGTRTVDKPPEDGATVVLTLDQQLQDYIEEVVERTCHEFDAKGVWAIVQRVNTGEILAMASFPTYDLNRYSKTPQEWMRNQAISYNFEPGSVMKAAVIASALDQGIVKTNDMVDCEGGTWYYGGRSLSDAPSHSFDQLSVADVIKYSSNIGTAKISMMMGEQRLYDSLKAFHFGSRLGIDLPGEEGGILYSPKNWSKISITRIGMGQEIAVTALQVASMMSTIAYNGVQMKPYLVSKVISADGTVLLENKPEELGRPISPQTARIMHKLLSRVTEDEGTGTKAQVEGYKVAGKTGTAQKTKPEGGYYAHRFWSTFAGFIPAENPQISIVVVVDDPVKYNNDGEPSGVHGGTASGPAFSEIAEMAVRYLRIPPDGDRIYVVRQEE